LSVRRRQCRSRGSTLPATSHDDQRACGHQARQNHHAPLIEGGNSNRRVGPREAHRAVSAANPTRATVGAGRVAVTAGRTAGTTPATAKSTGVTAATAAAVATTATAASRTACPTGTTPAADACNGSESGTGPGTAVTIAASSPPRGACPGSATNTAIAARTTGSPATARATGCSPAGGTRTTGTEIARATTATRDDQDRTTAHRARDVGRTAARTAVGARAAATADKQRERFPAGRGEHFGHHRTSTTGGKSVETAARPAPAGGDDGYRCHPGRYRPRGRSRSRETGRRAIGAADRKRCREGKRQGDTPIQSHTLSSCPSRVKNREKIPLDSGIAMVTLSSRRGLF